jgi:hypothetical protein
VGGVFFRYVFCAEDTQHTFQINLRIITSLLDLSDEA